MAFDHFQERIDGVDREGLVAIVGESHNLPIAGDDYFRAALVDYLFFKGIFKKLNKILDSHLDIQSTLQSDPSNESHAMGICASTAIG